MLLDELTLTIEELRIIKGGNVNIPDEEGGGETGSDDGEIDPD